MLRLVGASRRTQVAVLSTLVLGLATPAWAANFTAPTDVFELDGDSVTGNSAPNCDWDTLNAGKTATSTTPTAQCGAQSPRPGSTAGYGFVVGAPGEPNFTGGGSKDIHDISDWKWSTGSTPDKDTLTHGYAAGYTSTADGDNILVFGAERFAVNGDSNIGIWFFQQPISLVGTGKGTFSGVHTSGDILIVSAFTGGGGTSTISVYQWRPDLCPNSSYPKIPVSGQANVCADTNLYALFVDLTVGATQVCSSSSPACAIVNNQPATLAWPYLAKFGGATNTVPTGGLYEGGIDLTALLGGAAAPCFASFLFETRSSQSTDAVLKDFLLGSFPECHLAISKAVQCTSFNANGTFNYTYSGQVINDDGGDLFNVTVNDVKGQTYNCSMLPKGTTKTFGGSPLSADCAITTGTSATFATADHPASNQATATANTSASGGTQLTADTGAVTSTDATATSCSPRPGLALAKRCVTNFQVSGNVVEVRVDYTGEVTNTGNDNLSNILVSETASGTPANASFGPFNLAPGQSLCYTSGGASCPSLTAVPGLTSSPPAGAASYFPNGVNILATLQGRIAFSDSVSASGTDAFGRAVPGPNDPPVTATAQCVICPFGSCPTQ